MRYLLKNDNLTVAFDTRGGQIVSVKDTDGLEYLWQGNAAYWSGQAPVMFPICGSLRGKTATIGNGTTCSMERHGLVRKLDFTYLSQTSCSITFSICSNDELKASYPYDFELQITYTLTNRTITTSYHIYNLNPIPMPYFIGGHPGFCCPLLPEEVFEDYVIEFEKPETAACPASIPSTGLINVDNRTILLKDESVLPLKHSYFQEDALIFDQLVSRSVSLKNPKTGKGVKLDFADFPYFILWSSSNEGPFVALEPWTGISTCNDESDIFEEKRGVKFLPPKQSALHSFDITIL